MIEYLGELGWVYHCTDASLGNTKRDSKNREQKNRNRLGDHINTGARMKVCLRKGLFSGLDTRASVRRRHMICYTGCVDKLEMGEREKGPGKVKPREAGT